MFSTADTVSPRVANRSVDASRPGPSPRLAGFGALSFAAVVVLQNVIRGSSAPSNGASASEVLTHAADSRGITFVLVATFVVSGISLATFLGGVMRRLTASANPAWAYTGYVGGAGILALFSVLLASEQAISVVAHGSDPDLGAVSALWALHNSVFTVLLLFIGIALLGLGRAGVAAGITPRAFAWLAPLGTGLLAVACAGGPGIAAGELNAMFALGLIGFVIWLAFLVTTGTRLVRTSGPSVERIAGVTAMITETDRSTVPTVVASILAARLQEAWNSADGAAYGDAFADDADFVNIRGEHLRGRAAIAAGHQGIFDTIYAGSTNRYELERARVIGPGCVVAVVAATLQVPQGPLRGTLHARFTLTAMDGPAGWAISALHNTLLAPTH